MMKGLTALLLVCLSVRYDTAAEPDIRTGQHSNPDATPQQLRGLGSDYYSSYSLPPPSDSGGSGGSGGSGSSGSSGGSGGSGGSGSGGSSSGGSSSGGSVSSFLSGLFSGGSDDEVSGEEANDSIMGGGGWGGIWGHSWGGNSLEEQGTSTYHVASRDNGVGGSIALFMIGAIVAAFAGILFVVLRKKCQEEGGRSQFCRRRRNRGSLDEALDDNEGNEFVEISRIGKKSTTEAPKAGAGEGYAAPEETLVV